MDSQVLRLDFLSEYVTIIMPIKKIDPIYKYIFGRLFFPASYMRIYYPGKHVAYKSHLSLSSWNDIRLAKVSSLAPGDVIDLRKR